MQQVNNQSEKQDSQVQKSQDCPIDHPMTFVDENNDQSDILKSPPQPQTQQRITNLEKITQSGALQEIENGFVGEQMINNEEKWGLKSHDTHDIVPLVGSPEKASLELEPIREEGIVLSPEIRTSNPQTLSISQGVVVSNLKTNQDQPIQNHFLQERDAQNTEVEKRSIEPQSLDMGQQQSSEVLADFQQRENEEEVLQRNELVMRKILGNPQDTWMDDGVEQFRESGPYDLNEVAASDQLIDQENKLGGQHDDLSLSLYDEGRLEQNDRRFYTLEELEQLEPQFDKKFNLNGSGGSTGNQHMLLSPQEHRAKLYWLDQENKWKDIGTGRFRILLSKDGEEHYIQIVSEEGFEDARSSPNANEGLDEANLLENPDQSDPFLETSPPAPSNDSKESSKVSKFENELEQPQKRQQILHRSFITSLSEFQRQGSTIITWQDEYKNEFALSFQEEKGASDTWWSICFLKGIQINSIDEQKSERESQSDQGAHVEEPQLDEVSMPTKDNLQMVVSELSTNDQYARRTIAETILKRDRNAMHNNSGSPIGNTSGGGILDSQSERDHTKLSKWRSTYLDKLQKIFTEVEENYFRAEKAMEKNEGDEHYRQICMTQQIGNLHSLFQIFRNMLSLNQSELIEVLLNTHYWETTFGALEYDPEIFFPIVRQNGFDSGGDPNSPSQISYSSMSNFSGSPRSTSRTFGNGSHFGGESSANNQNLSPSRNLLKQQLQNKNGKDAEKGKDGMSDAESCNFRHFLKNQVQFREAVTIGDPQVLYFIHLSYKLQFLKDTAMARFIDEHTSRIILQLITSMHQYIIDYIFGEEFERIQTELLSKMQDRANVANKELALKFQLEICTLIKSLNLPNRQFQACNDAFAKLIHVMSQIFNIMIPNRKTLLAEVTNDANALIKEFEKLEENKQVDENPVIQEAEKAQNESKENEQRDSLLTDKENSNDAFKHVNIWKFNPGRDTIIEYMKKPYAKCDPTITQIDALKSNSIEVFNNLLVMNNSVVAEFVSNDFQAANNYVFLQHLAQHMLYSDQLGIKVGICEFFKDLIQRESPCDLQKKLQKIILMNILSIFLDFLQTDDFSLKPKQDNEYSQSDKESMKQEIVKDFDLISDGKQVGEKENKLFRRSLDQSRVLVLQLLESLVTDNGEMSFELKRVFIQNDVKKKVVECKRFDSIQTNVEIIKFFKAIIASKDSNLIRWIFSRDLFEQIVNIFLENKNKGNLLHSAILNLFEMLTPSEQQIQGMGSMAPQMSLNSHISNSWAPGGTSGGYVQIDLLNKLYKKLIESGLAQRIFFNAAYENDFKKFNRFLRNMYEQINGCGFDSSKDRDRSDSMPRKLQESAERSQTSGNQERVSPFGGTNSSQKQQYLRDNISGFNSDQNNKEPSDMIGADQVARSLNFKSSDEDLENELEQIAFGNVYPSDKMTPGQQKSNLQQDSASRKDDQFERSQPQISMTQNRLQEFLKEGDPSILADLPNSNKLNFNSAEKEKEKLEGKSHQVGLAAFGARQSEDDGLPRSPPFKDLKSSSPEDTIKIPFSKIGSNEKSPSQLQADSLAANVSSRPRRLSHDDRHEPSGGDQSGGRNGGGTSSKPGSIFSESSSNPDMDEIYFNQKGIGPSSVEFSIGNPQQQASRVNNLLGMDRQQSHQLSGQYSSAGIFSSPFSNQGKPVLSKPRSSRSKSTGQRYERKSRALSEDPCRNLKRDQAPLQSEMGAKLPDVPKHNEDLPMLYATKWSPENKKTLMMQEEKTPEITEQQQNPFRVLDSQKQINSHEQTDQIQEKNSPEMPQIGVKRNRKQFEEDMQAEGIEGTDQEFLEDKTVLKRHRSADHVDSADSGQPIEPVEKPEGNDNNPNEQIRPN